MASYGAQPPKADEVWNQKVIYLCQQKGCGADISLFPAAEKTPAPKHCAYCQIKENRAKIEEDWKTHNPLA
ncbi:MAG TPA: hypothetical protein VIJ14_00925 [Rhabdochlamydiaceae bacterium]